MDARGNPKEAGQTCRFSGEDVAKQTLSLGQSKAVRLISTQAAAELVGYTRDHVGLLLRRGIIKGDKPGRDWFVDEASLRQYIDSGPKPGPKRD
jgi:hypothetical protein